MFKKLSIIACEDITVRNLLRLQKDGCSVYRTSHAGNWNIYKLLLSQLGLPDCIWDVTCIHRDVNNQPRYQLIGGEKVLLLKETPPMNNGTRFLTPYYRTGENADETLSHFHVTPLKKLFGSGVTSQSEVLLEYENDVSTIFSIAERFMPHQLGRYILPCGCMVPLERLGSESLEAKCSHNRASVLQKDLAESALSTLKELRRLVFDPGDYIPKGGVVYSFELVVASFYLWLFWKFGDKPTYQLSGPDMIGYATKPAFISGVEKVLKVLGEHAPRLVPEKIDAFVVPATFFRFGYPSNLEVSERVMAAHETVRKLQALKREWRNVDVIRESLNHSVRNAIEIIERDGQKWNLFHDPSKDAFYSQHDMLKNGACMKVMEGYLDIPFGTMGKILETLPQTERQCRRLEFQTNERR